MSSPELKAQLELDFAVSHPTRRDASNSTVTPRASRVHSAEDDQPTTPLIPQTTGEWFSAFPSIRRSLLGGKSLNRFSSFVTSGAEEWILNGAPSEDAAEPATAKSSTKSSKSSETARPQHGHSKESTTATVGSDHSDESSDPEVEEMALSWRVRSEADRHFVDLGPAWRPKLPPFRVAVHSPSKRADGAGLAGAYMVYSVTSVFHVNTPTLESSWDSTLLRKYGHWGSNASTPHTASEASSLHEAAGPSSGEEATAEVTVHRRFSHFVFLHTALSRRLPGVALPPLPEKQYAGRFSDAFVEARRGDLQRYINKIVRHPVARYAEVVTFFLGCESDLVSFAPVQ